MEDEDTFQLLSPSKARQDAARAKDWSLVTSWLSRLYHPIPVPRFERNDETLHALLSLIATNAAADDRADCLLEAQKEELDILTTCSEPVYTNNPNQQFVDRIVNGLERSLDPTASEALAEIATTNLQLGSLSTDPESMGRDIVQLTADSFFVEDQIRKIDELRQQLTSSTARLQSELDKLAAERSGDDQEAQQQQIADWNRASKMLGIKFEEYREKVVALERMGDDALTIEDVQEKEKGVMREKDELRILEKELQGYHNLPPDLDEMKVEYQRLSTEVSRLQRKRDEMFANMANR